MANPVASQPGAATTVTTEDKGLLDQIVEQGRFGANPQLVSAARTWCRNSSPRCLKDR